MDSDTFYVYVIVRQDLSPSQQAVQACHACLESGKNFPWAGKHPHLVLVNVPDEPSLERWLHGVRQHDVGTRTSLFKVVEFREPDLNNSLTAIAVAGVCGKMLRSYFSALPLAKFTFGEKTKMAITQGRWGFYPCSYELFTKLKRLNKLALLALRKLAEHERWSRKKPHNRLIYIGCLEVREPIKKRMVPKLSRQYKPWLEPILAPIDGEMIRIIDNDYRNARIPVADASKVRSLVLNEQRICSLLAAMEKWYIDNGLRLKNETVQMAH